MNRRILKIEATGDFFRARVKPKIRLCGKWRELAGFKPGDRVELSINEPGMITLRCLSAVGGQPIHD